MRQTDRFVFFFGKEDVFSNWYQSRFTFRGVEFNCVEQFMMFSKAKLFGDHLVAERVLATANPKMQKSLGRTVVPFDQETWDAKSLNIVAVGCREKFAQNQSLLHALLHALLRTGDRVLVEASPYDREWGIGLAEDSPLVEFPEKWLGKNMLGQSLMLARQELRK